VADIGYVTTSVAQRIERTISQARFLHWNAAIVGDPGVGKTRALAHCAATMPQTYLFTVSAITGKALSRIFRELCMVLGVHYGTITDIQRRMFEHDFSGHVLLIDEAQNLNPQAIRELLYLNDMAQLSLIFCGNKEVLKRVSTDSGAFAQISSRVAFRETVDCILDADADAIASAFDIDGDDAYALTRKIAEHYHARGIVNVLTRARGFANSKKIKAGHIQDSLALFPQYRMALR
jgi:DNA transposition AAA+ family ATPase